MSAESQLSPLPWQRQCWRTLERQRSQGRLAHAYLFSGSDGIGKHWFARAWSAAMLCDQPREGGACGDCRSCHWFRAGSHPDFLEITPDADRQGIRIEQVRRITEFAQKTAMTPLGNKSIVLGPAETLGVAAANALLKCLEEPPGNTRFLLFSHLPGRVMATIRSRCQPLPLPQADQDEAVAWLRTAVDGDPEQAAALAPGRPLAARAMVEAGVPQLRSTLASALAALHDQRLQPIDCAEQLSSQDPQHVVQFMQRYVSALIRCRLTGGEVDEPLADRTLPGFEFDRAKARPQSRCLFGFYRELGVMQRQLSGTANPNARLLLESLFIRWNDVARQCL